LLTHEWQKERFAFRRCREPFSEQNSAATRGERLHNILAGLGLYPDKMTLVAALQARGLELGADKAEIELLADFLCREEIQVFFAEPGNWDTEVEIAWSAHSGIETARVDRLLEKKGETWVIEFKTGRERCADHRRQLEKYLKLLPIRPNSSARGFIVYLEPPQVEEIQWSK